MGICCNNNQPNSEIENRNIKNNQESYYIPYYLDKFIVNNSNTSAQRSFLDIESKDNSQSTVNKNQTFQYDYSFIKEYPIIEITNNNFSYYYSPELKEILTISSIIINLKASLYETILPIWVESGSKISFHVYGKWKCFDSEDAYSCKGFDSKHLDINASPYNLPFGSLCGYVQGEESVFLIEEKGEFLSKKSGSLVMFQNLGDWESQPSGSLLIILNGGRIRKNYDCDLSYGWDLDVVYHINEYMYLSDIEKSIIYYLNKLRINPVLFVEIYLYHKKKYQSEEEKCIEYLTKLRPVNALKIDYNLCSSAKIHTNDMLMNSHSSHMSSEGNSLKERLSLRRINYSKVGENICFGIDNPLELVKEMIFDANPSKDHRFNLVDEDFEYIGISFSSHNEYKFSCDLIFIKK